MIPQAKPGSEEKQGAVAFLKQHRKAFLQAVGMLLVLWLLLASFGMLFLPVERTQNAMIYQDGIAQEHTLVRWDGKLQYLLPSRLEFRGQIQIPQAQATIDPSTDMTLFIPLESDQTSRIRHTSWSGNLHSEDGPFLENIVYLDWWGKEFALGLSDGSILATSQEAFEALKQEVAQNSGERM